MAQKSIRILEIQEKNYSFSEFVNKLYCQKQEHNILKSSFDLNNQVTLFVR
jgi:predicted CopG family antitoxin